MTQRIENTKRNQPFFNFKKGNAVCTMKENGKKKCMIIFLKEDNKDEMKTDKYSKLDISDCDFQPIPCSKLTREIHYISGASGSGKTTYLKNFLEEYRKLNPKKNILLFSKLEEDPSIDGIKKLQRVILDDSYLEDPIQPEDLQDCFVVFDDIFAFKNKLVKLLITELINDICVIGRHFNTSIGITSHLLTNYRETRDILNETHYITFFPGSGSYQQIMYCLQHCVGIDKDTCRKLYELDSRWVTVCKMFPQYCIWQNGISLLKEL